MTFSNWNTSFLLERVAALEIVPNFDRKAIPGHGISWLHQIKGNCHAEHSNWDRTFAMREYQYGCTFYEKKYSHTGIFR